ncbi:hypothetical protein MJ575_11120 [Klebsiella pneumoniae]|nr:hypothetical protein MJ575_11120 [Klebsiella pneumoniae]
MTSASRVDEEADRLEISLDLLENCASSRNWPAGTDWLRDSGLPEALSVWFSITWIDLAIPQAAVA